MPPEKKPDEKIEKPGAPAAASAAPVEDDGDDDKSIDSLSIEEARKRLKVAESERKALTRKLADAGLSKTESKNVADEVSRLRDDIADLKKKLKLEEAATTTTGDASSGSAAVVETDEDDPLLWD